MFKYALVVVAFITLYNVYSTRTVTVDGYPDFAVWSVVATNITSEVAMSFDYIIVNGKRIVINGGN